MSHNIETMAYAGQVPWHGLGVNVNDNLTPEEMLKAAGLNWEVEKRSVHYTLGDDSFQFIPRNYALVRKSDDQFLTMVGDKYVPTQNKDAFQFFDGFVKECGLKMHTAGSLSGGQYVWALAKFPKKIVVAKGDEIDNYVLLMSPHKLGKALTAQCTTVRVVCQNTLNLALREGNSAFRFSHARSFDDRAKMEAAKALGLLNGAIDDFSEKAKTLAGSKANVNDVVDFFVTTFSMKESLLEGETPREKSLLNKLLIAYQGQSPGATLSTSSGTWWGALNAVTFVLDHQTGKTKDGNVRENWLGYRGTLKRKALALALEMAE